MRLRLDAVPYLCVREGTSNENLPETHAVLKQIRRTIDQRFPHAMLLARRINGRPTFARTSATATNATWRSTFH